MLSDDTNPPRVGRIEAGKVADPTGEWRNWQTRRIQVPVSERMWGFKSPLAHRLRGRCPRSSCTGSRPVVGGTARGAWSMHDLRNSTALRQLTDLGGHEPDPPDWVWAVAPARAQRPPAAARRGPRRARHHCAGSRRRHRDVPRRGAGAPVVGTRPTDGHRRPGPALRSGVAAPEPGPVAVWWAPTPPPRSSWLLRRRYSTGWGSDSWGRRDDGPPAPRPGPARGGPGPGHRPRRSDRR